MFATCLGFALALVLTQETAPIDGRLLDRRTGEPIAHFEVSVELRGRDPIRLVTGEDGVFATEAEFKKTRLSLGLIDHPRSPEPRGPSRARMSHDPSQQVPEDFRLEVGPRYLLELVDADGKPCSNPEQFDAFLYHDRPLARALPGGQEAPRAPVRFTGETWTRFRDRRCETILAGGPWWLEVRSLDGAQSGGARIESLEPDDTPVRIRLAASCTLTGRVVDHEGAPFANAALRLKQSSDLVWHERLHAEADGSFRIANLEPGDYELSVCDPRARGRRLVVPLEPGKDDGIDLVQVERFLAEGTLSGRITSRSGEYAGSGELVFEPLDKELFERPTIPLKWRTLEDESRVAEFHLQAPVGERYRLLLDTLDIFAWGSVAELTQQESPVEIVLDDRTQLLEITILDAKSGELIEETEVALSLGLYNDWLEGSYIELPDIPLAIAPDAFSWCVTASGYAPVFGDLNAFSELDGGVRSLVLELEPGWGNRFEVFDRRTLRPLSGVTVLLDEVAVGQTEAGWLDVRLPETPGMLDLSLEGWRWVGGSVEYRRIDLLEEEAVPVLLWMVQN